MRGIAKVLTALLSFSAVGAATPADAQFCWNPRYLLGTHNSYVAYSTSMSPTVNPDECVIATRVFRPEDLAPGSIIAFQHPTQAFTFIKRIVAVAGQDVQMIEGVLHIDGVAAQLREMDDFEEVMEPDARGRMPICPTTAAIAETCYHRQFEETLPNGASYRILNGPARSSLDDTASVTVPPGHVFVMGDHRDNSVDSRVPPEQGGMGFIPWENIVGYFDEISPESAL